jgi:putative transposase
MQNFASLTMPEYIKMELFQSRYRIPSGRLKNWDYGSPGLYFVTINTKNRESYFGEIIVAVETQNFASLQYSPLGIVAVQSWNEIPIHFPFIELDEYIIMPDHIHGIVLINKPAYNEWRVNKFGPQSKNLGSVIRGFKVGVKKYAGENKINFEWQPRYYDHIIRSENELNRIREYIFENPIKYVTKTKSINKS